MRAGVYLDRSRHTAIVVRVKDGHVWFLTMESGAITLEQSSTEKFAHQYSEFMPDYPVLRAVRKYRSSGLRIEDDAARVLTIIVARNPAVTV